MQLFGPVTMGPGNLTVRVPFVATGSAPVARFMVQNENDFSLTVQVGDRPYFVSSWTTETLRLEGWETFATITVNGTPVSSGPVSGQIFTVQDSPPTDTQRRSGF